MEQGDVRQETEEPQDGAETQEPEKGGSRWRRALNSTRSTGKGFKRAGKEITKASKKTGREIKRSKREIVKASKTTDKGFRRTKREIGRASRTTGRGIQRSGEVLSGADIRRFDEFTEAVTRVAVGLHHDQTDIRERVAQLEQESADIRRFQSELADRLATIERMFAANMPADS